MEGETANTSSLVRGLATLEKVEERVREDNRLSLIGGTSQHGSPYLRIWGSRALAVLNHTPLVEVVVVPQEQEEEVILCTLVSFRREVLHSATFNTGDLDTRTGSSSLLGYLQSRLGQNYSYCHGFPEATLLTSLVGHQLNATIFSKCLVERDVKGGQSLVVRSRHCQSVRPHQGPEDEERETLCSVCLQLLQSVLPPTKRTLLEDKASEQEEIKSCPVESCNRSFRREKPYQRHLKSHAPVKCDICSLAFLSETQLESHKKNAHTVTSSATNEDAGNFVPPSNVLSEKVENLQKSETPSLQKSRQFSCSICGAVYHYEKAFQKHVQTHRDDITKDRFSCDQCNHVYQTEEQLTDHKEQKHTYFDCDQCDSKSSSLKALDKHKRKLHSKTHEQCHICGKNVKRASMNNHVKMVHHADQMRRHICTICGNKYKTKTDLDRHYTKHTGNSCFHSRMIVGFVQDHNMQIKSCFLERVQKIVLYLVS